MTDLSQLSTKNKAHHHVLIAALASLGVGLAILNPLHPLLIVVVAILPIGAVIAFKNLFYLCLGFVVFSFFRIHEVFPFLMPFRIPILLALPTLGVLCWQLFCAKSLKPFWNRDLTAFAVFFGLVTLGLALAMNRSLAFSYYTATYIKIGIMVLAIAWIVRKPEDFATACRVFVIAGIAVALVTISRKLQGIGLVEGSRVTIGRDYGSVLGDPNDLSLVLLFPLSFATALAIIRPTKLDRLLGIVATLCICWAIVATQSRGGLLGIVSVLGIGGTRVIKNKFVLAGIGAVGLAALMVMAGIADRQSGGAAESGIDESAMGRIYAWQAAVNMALARPLNGVGLDNFVANYFYFTPHWTGMAKAVHSTWLGVLGETGFPGLIAFVTMVVLMVLTNRESSRILDAHNAPASTRATALALIGGITGFCISGTFLTQGFTWPIYILLSLTVALSRYAKELEPPAIQGASPDASQVEDSPFAHRLRARSPRSRPRVKVLEGTNDNNRMGR
ncbi:O-antigen ligase family protein [Pseudovibrio exalbescens]|uniref:O-antigen ligase family protein n=1 Tax=Pseudovibrio exalbescens TaxID=197461 RepID=UPI0023654511|nr:O-antigen ligase family protein [Pseudovibrio exalbescens]MDD7909217.1 O-antigen ligase family protein [Pseudovibrio exalbescens]